MTFKYRIGIDNAVILRERMNLFNRRKGPKCGEYLKYKGLYFRFSHDWGDSLQTSEGGSFYLGDGYMSYSGSLNHGIDKSKIEMTHKTKEGSVWFFDRDIAGAGMGRDFNVPLRIWRIKRGIKVDPYDIMGKDLCPKCKGLNFMFQSLGCKSKCMDCGEVR